MIRKGLFHLVIFLLVLLVTFQLNIAGQNDDLYTVKGRVIDDRGLPLADVGICVEPVVDRSTAFDSFTECVGTVSDGRFGISKFKNEFTIGQNQFLFVYAGTSSTVLTTIDPPFVWIRRYDKAFNGKLIRFGSKSVIDLGDVKVQFWFGQANLDFSQFKSDRRAHV